MAASQHIPVIGTFHSKYKDDFSRVIKSKVVVNSIVKGIVEFYENCDEVWVPQDSVREVIKEYGYKGHVEVVENGCDMVADYPESFFSDARRKLGIAP